MTNETNEMRREERRTEGNRIQKILLEGRSPFPQQDNICYSVDEEIREFLTQNGRVDDYAKGTLFEVHHYNHCTVRQRWYIEKSKATVVRIEIYGSSGFAEETARTISGLHPGFLIDVGEGR